MVMPTQKVELGFDLTDTGRGPFFRLDDEVQGALDNTEFVLGGTLFFDVTDKVKSVAIRRGKSRELDQFDQGLANVVFDNNDRTFDPVFEASQFFGQIIPKRQIRISSGGIMQFAGLIDDFNLDYEVNGDSLTSAACSDALSSFAVQTIPARTNSVQQSGQRINTILSLPDIDWPEEEREIDEGLMQVGPDIVADNTNALEYLRLVERTELGLFFIGKTGKVVFKDRVSAPTSGGIEFSDDGTAIPYQGMKVQFGSELLANEIVVKSVITDLELLAIDEDSVDEYGIFNLTRTDLIINNNDDLAAYATFLANKFSQPEYRFESIDLLVDELPEEQQQEVLSLEMGDVVSIKFTPNGIAPAIEKFGEVIRIDHSIDIENHVTSLGFATLDFALLVLDDAVFGKLDAGNALAF
jgi:hypothetical protein